MVILKKSGSARDLFPEPGINCAVEHQAYAVIIAVVFNPVRSIDVQIPGFSCLQWDQLVVEPEPDVGIRLHGHMQARFGIFTVTGCDRPVPYQ